MTRLGSLLFIVGLLAAPVHVAAQAMPVSDTELKKGITQVEEGDLENAVVTLDSAIQRLSAEKGHENDVAAAHLYLAMTHLGLSQIENAKAEVRAAWRNNSQMRLDPAKFPPMLIKMYDDARQEGDAKPAAAKKRGHTGLALGILGAAAAGGIVAAASGGGGATPAPVFSITNARFQPAQLTCPIGPPNQPIYVPNGWTIAADARDDSGNPIYITSCTMRLSIASSDIPSEVGTTVPIQCSIFGSSPLTFSAPRTILIVGSDPVICVNGDTTTHVNHWSGVVNLETTRGKFQLVTTNTFEVINPVAH